MDKKKKKGILIGLNTIFIILLFILMFIGSVHLIINLLVCTFLWLFFYGIILKARTINIALFQSHSKQESPRKQDKEQYKIKLPRRVETKSLDFNYKKPLIIKCPNCGMTLISSMKKCPNCGKNLN